MRGRSVVLLSLLILSSVVAVSAQLDLDTLLLKIAVVDGDSTTKSFTVSSSSNSQIRLELVGTKGITLEKNNFFLSGGSTESIDIVFNATTLEPGFYPGAIRVIGSNEVKLLPVMFEVESEDLFFDLNLDIAPQYSEVHPGEYIIVGIRIFDLTGFRSAGVLDSTEVTLDYQIVGANGKLLVSDTENLVVRRQTELTKSLKLPDDAVSGDYFIGVSVKHQTSLGTSTYLFSIEEKPQPAVMVGPRFSQQEVLAAMVFIVLVLILMYIRATNRKEKLLIKLSQYNTVEIKRQKQLLQDQERILLQKKPGLSRTDIKKEIDKHVIKLRDKHRRRVNSFKKIKKVKELQQKLDNWKASGYNTLGLEYRLKGLGKSEMNKMLSKWKKKGYK